MKKFIIERDLPGTGKLTAHELKAFAAKSCYVADDLGVPYHWVHTFVTDKKIYCIHIATDRETVMRHAQEVGIPVDHIEEIKTIIDPTTSAIRIERPPRSVFE
jgi:hypothetical protein